MADDATPAPGTDEVPIAAQDAAAVAPLPTTETPTVPLGGEPAGTTPAAA